MKSKVLFFICAFLFFQSGKYAFAQKEKNVWCFGNKAGLDFNSGSPVPFTSAITGTYFEGCASISDRNTGALLFYTNGETVWDKTHSIMSNGTSLNGCSGSTQSSLIARKPGSNTQYYIFTTDAQAGVGAQVCPFTYGGLSYSEVDMSAGNGTVTTKNTPLITPTAEKLTGIRLCDDNVWIITHGWDNNSFHAFKVTSSGVALPVTSNIGPVHKDSTFCLGAGAAGGEMKISPDGKKLALGTWQCRNTIEIYDFDINTGVVSNPIVDKYGTGYNFRSICFSPDNTKLYCQQIGGTGAGANQYDLLAGSAAAIIASKTYISRAGGLQVTPDGNKIYMGAGTKLDVFNTPNAPGAASGYVADAVSSIGGTVWWGLPNFLENISSQQLVQLGNDTTLCSGSLMLNAGGPWTGYLWSTGATTQTITISTSGTYSVQITNNGCTASDTIKITYLSAGTVALGNDTAMCGTANLFLNAGNPGSTYLWSSAATTQTINVSSAGTYWVQVNNNGCIASDTIKVTYLSAGTVALGNDTVVCSTVNLLLDAGNPGSSYLWSTNATTQTISVAASGTYWAQITNIGCTASDTIKITYLSAATVNLGNDTALCGTINFLLNAGNPGSTYVWSTGETTQSISALSAGTYWVEVNNGGCKASDTLKISNAVGITASSVVSNVSCNGGSNGSAAITISGGTLPYAYLWSNTQTTSAATGLGAGTYSAVITDAAGCSNTATVSITSPSALTVLTNQTNILCNGGNASATVTVSGGTPGYIYSWSPSGGTNATASNIVAGTYTITATDFNGCTQTQTLTITEPPALTATATFSPTACDINNGSATATGSGGTSGYAYSWNTLPVQSTSVATGLGIGNYTCIVTDANNCTKATTVNINAYPDPTANAGVSTTITIGSNTSLNATGGVTYVWSPVSGLSNPNISNPVASPTMTTQYCVTVTDANGCTDDDCITIYVETPCPDANDLSLPNAFSPNSDGQNDEFCLQGAVDECIKDLHITIYDRWGEKVHESTDRLFCWDGRHKEKTINTSVFVYYLEVTTTSNTEVIKRGNVSLVR